MDVRLLAWEPSSGWSAPLPSELDGPSTLVLAFGSPPEEVAAARLAELAAALPQAQLAGCSTAGEILDRRVAEGEMSVAVARFAHTTLRRAEAAVAAPTDSRQAGRELAGTLVGPGLRGVLVLSDGLGVNGTELLNGVKEVLPAEVVVTGGLAGDGDRFAATWVVAQGRPTAGVVSAIGLYGDRVRIGHGSWGGWDSFGVERQVTRSDGNVLYELDGEPALALYKRYLGERAAGLPATALLFPLVLCADDGGAGLVRTVLGVDEANQSLTFAGDLPQGSRVQLMRANFDRLVEGAATAGQLAYPAEDPRGGCLAIAISCVGRRLVLGERTEEEVEAVLDSLPPASSQVGFYSYGEISPTATGPCELHNQTMTLTTLVEA
ncbi:MAG TPA: FIST N-terminal domain-containing protein [Propionibacteriaceae bacterium]|nr:FIST N-terminal domain-containing protein [Propionibacteriaceae bacterium]